MGIASGREYVKTSGEKIYLRGSCYDMYSSNSFSGYEARQIAGMLVTEADKLDGTSSGPITLTLDRCEAEALASVLHRVGGDARVSPRAKVKAINERLTKAGVKPQPSHKFECVAGGLWFKSYTGRGADAYTKMLAETIYAFVDD